MSSFVSASTVLPAHREPITLTTADGITLVGELAVPADRPPQATLICFHPLPTHGGSMDSHLFRKAAWRLPAQAGLAVLRFNSRGTSSPEGTSGGQFSAGGAEKYDLNAALEFATKRFLPRLWLVGWSFGTDVVLLYGCQPGVEGALLLSPPLARADDVELTAWGSSGKQVTVMVPEFDDYLRPAEARQRFSLVPQARVIGVEGAHHLWVGEKYVTQVLNQMMECAVPGLNRAAPAPAR
ncbi:MAG: alpha/beta hydrolase [Cellulomonadaceae bacterium]|jgi:alpha/beta superfamily hydrolase|nr:alpha/beta hydrolase [Cellulomonadaceae bacterium]